MAEVQHVRGASQLSEKEKAAIEEAVKVVQASIEKNINNAKAKAANREQLVLVTGNVQNLQLREVILKNTHDWNGKFLVNPPERIAEHATGTFEHEGAISQGNLPLLVGSKGAIIYGHSDLGLPNNLAWLFAWDKPENSNGVNKVYVDAGDLSRITKIEWSEIEQKLDASSESFSRYFDSATGAIVAAKLEDQGDKLASLAASFHIYTPPISQA